MSEMKVTVTVPIETHEVPAEKFSLKALGLDVPENAIRGFLILKNWNSGLFVLGRDVCNRLTRDHGHFLGGKPVTRDWGHAMDAYIEKDGSFALDDNPLEFVRVEFLNNPASYEMAGIRQNMQRILANNGSFKISIEEIIQEADYASPSAVAQSEHDDDDDEYDDDQPF